MTVEASTDTVADSLARMQAAWNAGDAAAFADEFADDATYVIFAGIVSLGRAEIHRDHEPVFARWQRGSRMEMHVIDEREIAPGVVVVLTEGGVGKGSRVALDKVQTFTMLRTEEGWKCAAFQNTKKNGLFVRMNSLFAPRAS